MKIRIKNLPQLDALQLQEAARVIEKSSFRILRTHISRLVVLAAMMTLLVEGAVAAPNLIPNPSFEINSSCPTGLSSSQIAGVTIWTAPTTGSPDYFHVCAVSSTGVSIPVNTFGNQPARTGTAYAGFILRPQNQYREYLETPLSAPLTAGTVYNVSFYVSLSDASQWAIDKIGAYLSVGSVGPVNNGDVLTLVPQVVNPSGNFITNKSDWTLVSGTYVAVGGEDHLVIGNFSDDSASTTITGLGGFYPGSYYYVDDVSVEKADKQGECVQVEGREAVCKTDGSGYTYTFSVTNNSGKDVEHILLTPGGGGLTLSQQVFDTPLHPGQSTTITVNLGNVKPGSESCFFLTLMTKDGPCCTVKVCPVLPDCCATAKGEFKCDAKGGYTGTFSIVNTSPNTIKNIYLYPPAGVTLSQTYFAVTLAPGQSFTTPVITIKGAKPGRLCFRVSMHTEGMKDCCEVEFCIVLPECGIHNPS